MTVATSNSRSIEQIQVHYCGHRLDSVYVFLSMSWSETLLTHLNLRPVGGHPRSVVVLPPFEVVLLVDGRQRLMELVVHCLNTDKSTACVGWRVFLCIIHICAVCSFSYMSYINSTNRSTKLMKGVRGVFLDRLSSCNVNKGLFSIKFNE